MEARSVQNRLAQHEEQIHRLQSDITEIKSSLQVLEADRVENAEFRKIVMEWVKGHGMLHVYDFSEFHTVKKIKLSEFSPQGEVVIDPLEIVKVAIVEDEEPVLVVIDKVWESESSQLIVESNTSIEETPKKSYASMVLDKKQIGVPFSLPAPSPRISQPRNQEQQVINVPPFASATDAAVNAVGKGIHEEKAVGDPIYIKDLPMTATSAMLGNNENENANGNYCRFEELLDRDLPPPEPPDP